MFRSSRTNIKYTLKRWDRNVSSQKLSINKDHFLEVPGAIKTLPFNMRLMTCPVNHPMVLAGPTNTKKLGDIKGGRRDGSAHWQYWSEYAHGITKFKVETTIGENEIPNMFGELCVRMVPNNRKVASNTCIFYHTLGVFSTL